MPSLSVSGPPVESPSTESGIPSLSAICVTISLACHQNHYPGRQWNLHLRWSLGCRRCLLSVSLKVWGTVTVCIWTATRYSRLQLESGMPSLSESVSQIIRGTVTIGIWSTMQSLAFYRIRNAVVICYLYLDNLAYRRTITYPDYLLLSPSTLSLGCRRYPLSVSRKSGVPSLSVSGPPSRYLPSIESGNAVVI